MSSSLLYSDIYGDVYKQKKDGSLYLVKIIKSKNLKSKNNMDTLDSMKKLSLIVNQNLSEYVDFYFNENGDFEILMEYDEDSEFELKIKYNIENHRNFEEDYIWSLIIQILNLLKFIQQNEDIKIEINPSKILLMNNGSLKIFDYGMDLISNIGLSSSISPNNDYTTPPELVKEDTKIIDENSANIWRAGCIIYELCTLQHVFEFESMFDMQIKLSQFTGVYKLNIDNKYSDDLQILLSKMLIAEPEKRATIDELLNFDIIKKKNDNLFEKEDLEKKLLKASIFTFKQSILKNSLKESIRQIKNQNEMMEYDNYELLKFSLSKNKDLENIDENVNYLKQTGFFGKGEENEFTQKDDFKKKLMSEKMKKENKNIFNYNNPYRIMNNNFIIEEYKYNNDIKKKINKKNIKDNKKEIIKLKVGNNYIEKLRDKTPVIENKTKNYFLNVDKNINIINNKNKSKNKERKNNNIFPRIDNPREPSNIFISKELKKNYNNINNINNVNLVKKTEQVLKLFNKNKVKKTNGTNKQMKQNNKPNISSMDNSQIDFILNKILHNQNVRLVNKIQNNANNINNKNLIHLNKPTNNKIKLKLVSKDKNFINVSNKLNKKNNAPYGTMKHRKINEQKPNYFLKNDKK